MLRSTVPFRFSAPSSILFARQTTTRTSPFVASSASSSNFLFRRFLLSSNNNAQISFNTSRCSNGSVFNSSRLGTVASFHSLALEQAMRITSPSAKHPATGDSDPTGSANVTAKVQDPAVIWREHWDVEFERPYYHNLVTNEVRTTLPEGFPTRFLFYFQKQKGGVLHEASDAGRAPEHATRAKTMKERIKDYGLAGLFLYSVIHFGMLAIIFAVMMAGVDVRGLLKSVGIDIGNRLKGDNSIMAVWLVAILVNKVFVPLQLLATLSLAPKLAPVLKTFLIRLGIRA